MDERGGVLFEELSDCDRLKEYVGLAVKAMKEGGSLPNVIEGIFDTDVLDLVGELYSCINGLMKRADG